MTTFNPKEGDRVLLFGQRVVLLGKTEKKWVWIHDGTVPYKVDRSAIGPAPKKALPIQAKHNSKTRH